jgi:mannosyltransferase
VGRGTVKLRRQKAFRPNANTSREAVRKLAAARYTLVAIGLLVATLAFRVAFLGDRQLFRDEAASWLLARYPLPQLITHAGAEPYPPLYALVLKGWVSLAGDSEVALRSISVLFGLALVLIGWQWARESLGRRAGLIALAFLAISPLAIANARDVRMYAMDSTWTTLGWWLTWRLASGKSQGPRRRIDAAILAIAVAAELWTFSFGLPVAALQLVVSAVPWMRHRRIEHTLAPAAIVAGGATFLPWLPTTLVASGHPFWTPPPPIWHIGETFAVMIGGGHPPWVLGACVVFVLAGVGVAVLFRARAAVLPETDEMQATGPLLGGGVIAGLALVPLVWTYSQFHSFYDSRYFGASLAPLALAAAIGCCWAFDRIQPVLARTIASIVLAVLLVGGAFTWLDEWRTEVGLAPAQELLAALQREMHPGDVALSLDARSYFQLAYLLGRETSPARLPGPLLAWDSGNEPYYFGQSLLSPQTLVSAGETNAVGWKASLPGLAPGGRIWLIALANGATEDLAFEPLVDGELHEIDRVLISPRGETGQLRELVLPAR